MFPQSLSATVLAVFATGAIAADVPASPPADPLAGSSFYQDKERGWFWYEDPPEEIVPPVEPEKPEPPKAPESSKIVEPAPADGPAPGTVAWLRVMLPKLRDQAIDNPTRENMSAYYFAQRLMLDKAERFSRNSVETIRNDPFLDEDMRYPASNAAADAISTESGKQRDLLMRDIAKSSSLVFFYKGSNCVLCDQAIAAISALEFKYGFSVLPISMDGNPLPNGKYPNTKYDNGLAKKLGVITAPALAIAIPPNDVKIVAFSTVSMDTAISRILVAAKDSGLITGEELAATSRVNTVGLIDSASLTDLPSDVLSNPSEFSRRVREEARKAFIKSVGGE